MIINSRFAFRRVRKTGKINKIMNKRKRKNGNRTQKIYLLIKKKRVKARERK